MRRESKFELLRIVLMLMVITGHIMMYDPRIGQIGTLDYYLINAVRSFVMVAVNVFILMSGYFGIALNARKMLHLDVKVCLYTWAGYVASVLLSIHSVQPLKDIQLLFPVLTRQYWFVTVYFVLCVFSPFLNDFLREISEEKLRLFLILGLGIFYVLPTFCFIINAPQIVMDSGYGVLNFIYLYCLGYYIRHYYKECHSAVFYLGIYGLSCILLFAVNTTLSEVLGFYFNSLISYNTIFVLSGAVGLFMAFKELRVPNTQLINILAKNSFSVYIIHSSPTIARWLMSAVFGIGKYSGIVIIPITLVNAVIVYTTSIIIDTFVENIVDPIEDWAIRVLIKFRRKWKRII